MSKERFFSMSGFLVFLLVITPCHAQKILDFSLGEQDVTLKGEKAFDECGYAVDRQVLQISPGWRQTKVAVKSYRRDRQERRVERKWRNSTTSS